MTEYRQKLDEAKRKYKEIIDRMYSLERKIVTMRETITREVHRIEQLEQKHGSSDAPKITTPLHDCQVCGYKTMYSNISIRENMLILMFE